MFAIPRAISGRSAYLKGSKNFRATASYRNAARATETEGGLSAHPLHDALPAASGTPHTAQKGAVIKPAS